MAIRKGRCSNFGNCAAADCGQLIEVADGQDLTCSQCHGLLSEVTRGLMLPVALAVIAGAIVVLALVAWALVGGG